MAFSLAYLKTPSGLLKILEIITVVIAFGIFRGGAAVFSLNANGHANYFGSGVLVCAMIITPLLLTCYIMGRYEIQKTIFEMVFNFLMFVFLLASGGVTVDTFQNRNLLITSGPNNLKQNSLAMGSFCIISSLAYLGDTVCAVYLYRK